MAFLVHWAQSVGEMPSSIALRESLWVYPIIETGHVLGLCLFVGTAWLWDLRLLGLTLRRVPVSQLSAQILPWTVVGFIGMGITGLLLVFSDPMRFYFNIFFRAKVVMLIFAGLNAWVFHTTIGKNTHEWDLAPIAPLRAKVAGGVSLGLWALIIVTGRLIAYNWFGAVHHS
jgi:uncharacterized protein DUF6644